MNFYYLYGYLIITFILWVVGVYSLWQKDDLRTIPSMFAVAGVGAAVWPLALVWGVFMYLVRYMRAL